MRDGPIHSFSTPRPCPGSLRFRRHHKIKLFPARYVYTAQHPRCVNSQFRYKSHEKMSRHLHLHITIRSRMRLNPPKRHANDKCYYFRVQTLLKPALDRIHSGKCLEPWERRRLYTQPALPLDFATEKKSCIR